MRLLFVEDEPTLARQALPRLRSAGFDVDHAVDSAEALLVSESETFDVVAVDFGLPMQGGPRLVRGWREIGFDTPILALTAGGGWREKVDAVRFGADDALSKPFRFEELTLRLKRLATSPLRRSQELAVGELSLDERSETATISGRSVALEVDEARVLALLMRRAGEVVTRAEIVDAALSRSSRAPDPDTARPIERDGGGDLVADCVNRLRRKIGGETIQIVSDLGFRLG